MDPSSNPGNAPTSEDGTPRAEHRQNIAIQVMADSFKTAMNDMMAQMSHDHRTTLTEMIKIMKSEESKHVRISDVYFPAYDPDSGIDVRDWVDLISRTQTQYGLQDHEVRLKAAGVLQGRAKIWANSSLLRTTTWTEMRDDMLQTFEPESRYFADVLRFRNYTLDDADNVQEYISNVWRMFRRIVKPDPTEQDAVEFVIGSIGDERIRTELLNSKSNSVPELIAIAKTIRKRKLSNPKESEYPKRPRLDYNREGRDRERPNLTCFVCGKNGHFARNCIENAVRREKLFDETRSGSSPPVKPPLAVKECSYCKGSRHTVETCFKRIAEEQRSKKINLCQSTETKVSNTILAKIGQKQFDCIFDSGADCSLIQESVASSIPGQRTNIARCLRGIGPVPIYTNTQIRTGCDINGVLIELEFCVVLDHQLPEKILIGRDLLSIPGIKVELSNKGTFVRHAEEPSAILTVQKIGADDVHINPDLSAEDHDALMQVLNKYQHAFVEGTSSNRVTTGELTIKLKNPDKIVQRRPYRMAPVEREKVQRIIQDLLDNGIIQESNSPFASPIILVKKKNGEDRLCVDYRELNANTVRDNYPLPLISDQLDQLADAKYFCCLDMAAGFHQIPVAQDSIEKTAFITPDGQFEYLTMPFGLSNAPSVYQRCINKALGQLRGTAALVYIDDVLVSGKSVHETLQRLDLVLEALSDSGFAINITKCYFMKRSIEYLGYIIAEGQIRPDSLKVEALARSPVPENVKQLRQFNGLAGYFRKFVPNFSSEMTPLYELTKTGAKWEWTDRHEAARTKIIDYLTQAPLLTIFQEGLPIKLHTDASAIGFGAVLIQIKEGRQHVVGYFSQRTTKAESNYHSYELETLAVVRSVKHFRHFLYGRKFTIVTDCNALKASRYKQELLPRVHRWWSFLQNYDFEVEYRKGERLKHADFFSRNPVVQTVLKLTSDEAWLTMEQHRDPVLSKIIENIQQGRNEDSDYFMKEDILCQKVNMENGKSKALKVVPQSYQWSIINHYHESLKHFGWEKTLQKLKEQFWFDKMSSKVRSFIDNCVVCKTMKGTSGATQVELHPIEKVAEPFHTLHIDITGKLSGPSSEKEYVFVAIDAFSKFVILRFATKKNQESALQHLKEVIFLFGAPKRIVVDGDGAFVSQYEKYCKQYGIDLHHTAAYTSRANGQAERMMRVIKDGLTVISNIEKSHWESALGALQLAINCTVSKATGKTPIELLTGKNGSVPPELISMIDEENERVDPVSLRKVVYARMTEQSKKDKARFDNNKAKVKRFEKGEYVLVKESARLGTKLSQKFGGPYEVKKVFPNDRYEIKKITGRGRPRKVAHENLRPAPNFGKQNETAMSAEEHEKIHTQNGETSNL